MGDLLVNSRKVVFIFWSTLLLGSLSGGIVGVLTNLDRYLGDGAENFLIGLVWMLGISAAFTLVSQMGFFSHIYLYIVLVWACLDRTNYGTVSSGS